jgi:hypothetical protein
MFGQSMPKYVFFTRKVEPVTMINHAHNIRRDTIPYWQYFYPKESQYVIDHCTDLTVKIERYYETNSIVARVVGTMSEKDFVWYMLKYASVGQAT